MIYAPLSLTLIAENVMPVAKSRELLPKLEGFGVMMDGGLCEQSLIRSRQASSF